MRGIIVTNNIDVKNEFDQLCNVIFLENKNYIDVLIFVRDKIHMGHQLLTHVLSGSIKPNETPYKSILITQTSHKMDMKSLHIVESSIQVYNKFEHSIENPKWTEKHLKDFRVIDLSLIKNAIENAQI